MPGPSGRIITCTPLPWHVCSSSKAHASTAEIHKSQDPESAMAGSRLKWLERGRWRKLSISWCKAPNDYLTSVLPSRLCATPLAAVALDVARE
jgi:hypothetical protein